MSGMNEHPGMKSESNRMGEGSITCQDMAWLVVIFLLCFLLYWPSLEGPFLFDDLHNIYYNAGIQITSLSPEALWQAAFSNKDFFRPLPMASFGVNHYLHGMDTKGYHLVNMAIHFLAAVFLFLFIRKTLLLPACRGQAENASLLAALSALLWMAHPVQTQSVSYVVQRMNSMAGMFFILSLLLYVYGRTSPDKKQAFALLLLSAVSAMAAFTSKENAFILPLIVILYEWLFIRDFYLEWFSKHWAKLAVGAGGFALLVWLLIGDDIVHWICEGYDIREFTLWERIFTEWRVVVWYLSLLILPLPSRMTLMHDFPVSHTLFSNWETLAALGLIMALIALSIVLIKRHRLISFALLWFFACLVMESSIFGLELVFEHRLYVPSMMLCVLPGLFMFQVIKRPLLAAIPLLCLAAAFGYGAYERNLLWGDGVALMEDCVVKNPCSRSYYNLAHTLLLRGQLQAAYVQNEKGLAADYKSLEKESNMLSGRRLLTRQRMAENCSTQGRILFGEGDTTGAVEYYKKALSLRPGYGLALNNLGLIYAKAGHVKEGIQLYKKALADNPLRGDTLANMGDAQAVLGNLDKAASFYSQALVVKPSVSRVHASLARVLVNQGRFQKGIEHFMTALALDPGDQDSQNALLTVHKILDEMDRLKDAIAMDPENASPYFELAKLWFRHNRLEQAALLCSQGLEKDPANPVGLNQLGKIRMDQGRFVEAEMLLLETARVLGDNVPSLYNLACMYSRQNKNKEAVYYLKAAVDKGFNAWDLLRTDPDLENARNTADFQTLVPKQAEQSKALDMSS